MSISYQELLDRAIQLGTGLAVRKAGQVVDLDREMTVEAIVPHAIRAVCREIARSGRRIDEIMFDFTIDVTGGKGDLPESILKEHLDKSFSATDQFAAQVPYEDYNRYRFDKQMAYYAIRGSYIYYSGSSTAWRQIAQYDGVTGAEDSSTLTGQTSSAVAGDRVRLLDPSNCEIIIVDAIIDEINADVNFTVLGYALATSVESGVATFYVGNEMVPSTIWTDVETNENNNLITSDTANFTASDIGRRIKVYDPDNSNAVIVDAIIQTVESTEEVTIGAKSKDSGTFSGSLMYQPFILRAAAVPDACDCSALVYNRSVTEDVIVKTAAVLKGELSLQSLIQMS